MFKRTKKTKRGILRKKSRKNKNHRKSHGGGQNSISICIYSHSSVFDVLQAQVDYLSKLFNGTEQKIYFFLDKEFTGNNHELKYTTILYDDNTAYTSRLSHCLAKVDTPYCIVSQENDILVKYNTNAMEALARIIAEKNIDSVDLVVRDLDCEKQVEVTDTLYIMNLKGGLWHRNTNLLYTVQPRLWNRASAIKMFSSIGEQVYKDSERGETQEYVNANQRVYGLCSTKPVMSFGILSEPFPVAEEYVFIHITKDGKFVRKASARNALHSDIEPIENDIHETYIKPSVTREQTTGDGTRAYVVNGFPGFFKKV